MPARLARGVPVGTLIAGWDGWRAHLHRMCAHQENRGHGVAKTLLAAAEDRLSAVTAAGLGAAGLDAVSLQDNELGQAFWSRSGFDMQDRWRRWVRRASPKD